VEKAAAAMSDAQEEILSRIRHAQYSTEDVWDVEAALNALGPAPAAPLDFENLLESFLLRLNRNKMTLDIAPSRTAAAKQISDFLYREHNTRRVVASYDPRLAAMPWREGGVLVRFDVAVPEDPASISYAKVAIAESGSVVLFSNRDNPAANNWLVSDHIVIVEEQDLVASYEDAWARIRELVGDTWPRGVNFIAGPSSTGDIGGHHVMGAHGPQRLHVVYIGNVAAGLQQSVLDKAAAIKA
jgi:L-lactate dehydrogenase complex protein LldG